ncbi:MAG TPA: type II secretion system protein [Planctomycetota bacterium]|nr:type II secretion system protein [Planctomycetota bacterium]
MKARPGFTLIEMMIVLAVSLAIMGMMVPMFTVSTRTVATVEAKLQAYQSARMILDIMETEIRLAHPVGERGEIFAIKNYHIDTMGKDKFANYPDPSKRYALSRRREGDCALFGQISRLETYAGNSYSSSFNLGLVWPNMCNHSAREGQAVRFGGDLMHKNFWELEGYRTDVSKIEFSLSVESQYQNVKWWWDAGGNTLMQPLDMETDYYAPGKQWGEPLCSPHHAKWGWEIPGIRCMDVDIAWWDDVNKQWCGAAKDQKYDFTSIYLAPIPKAVRFTITVCDPDKKSKVTLSRVVRMPAGNGSGAIDPAQGASTDTAWFQADPANPKKPLISQYNRLKDLNSIEPHLMGKF